MAQRLRKSKGVNAIAVVHWSGSGPKAMISHSEIDAMGGALSHPRQPAACYATLFLPKAIAGTVEKQELLLPLALAYVLSEHISFRFPLSQNVLPLAEAVFDEILCGPLRESKGIQYLPPCNSEGLAKLIGTSVLVFTEQTVLQDDRFTGQPQAVICYGNGNGEALDLRNLEKLEDAELRAKLSRCAQDLSSNLALSFSTRDRS